MTQPPRLHTLRPTMHSPETQTHPEPPNLSGEPLTGIPEVSGQAPESQEDGAGVGEEEPQRDRSQPTGKSC